MAKEYLYFRYEFKKLPESLEIGMFVQTKKGEIIEITHDDMIGYTYEDFVKLVKIRIQKKQLK